MTAGKEAAEYRALCAALGILHGKYLEKKKETLRLLEETLALKRKALAALAKATRFTRHLNGRQRQVSGISCVLDGIKERINQADRSAQLIPWGPDSAGDEIPAVMIQEAPDSGPAGKGSPGLREIKRKIPAVLRMIGIVKKNLLRIELLEHRCRELAASIRKAMEAFRHEFRAICRKLYPYGIFSVFRRSLRRLTGNSYFSSRDMDGLAALGRLTGWVLKIAGSPVI